jgi:hypothetical protein
MAKFTGKNDFANGDAVTAASLNQITDNLQIASDSFSGTFTVNSGVVSVTPGGISRADLEDSSDLNTGINAAKITDGAITTDKLPDSTSTTDGVTYQKLQYVSANNKLLGRTTSGSGVVEELDIYTSLAVVSSDDDTIPSAKAVKDYVDSAPNFVPSSVEGDTDYVKLPNGLIFKMGSVAGGSAETTITFDSTLEFTTIYSVQVTAVDNSATVYPVSIKSVSNTAAVVVCDTGVDSIYYTAIGR